VELHARVPEPEVMDDPEHARTYSEADFSAPHSAFVDEFWRRFPGFTTRRFDAIDLGCGPADVTARFAQAHPGAQVVGIDASGPMVELGRARIACSGLDERVVLEQRRLPDPSLGRARFDVVLSNSLLHHLADPLDLWDAIAEVARPGAAIFVMDLHRPQTDDEVHRMVDLHAGDEPTVLQDDFRASLRAAYRPDEIAEQIARTSLTCEVEGVGDRHVVVWGRR
jgi:SAM-dependent methyltransferase